MSGQAEGPTMQDIQITMIGDRLRGRRILVEVDHVTANQLWRVQESPRLMAKYLGETLITWGDDRPMRRTDKERAAEAEGRKK